MKSAGRVGSWSISSRALIRVVLCVVILVWPLIYQNNYALSNMRTAGLYALLALSTNLIMGQAGQLSFGVMAFAGVGGYTVALTTVRLHWPTSVALIAGILFASLVGLIIGKPVLKLKFYFLALATMALVTIFTVVIQTASSVTYGIAGVPGIPWLNLGLIKFDTYLKQYMLIWVIVLAVLLFCEAAMRARTGRALKSLAANDVAASSLGVKTASWKLRTFVVSSGIAGLGGGLWALLLSSATPTDFSLPSAITVVLMVMVGGMDSLLGAIVGAVIITWLTYSLGPLQSYSGGAYALVLILLALFFPGGLAGLAGRTRLGSLLARFDLRMQRRRTALRAATAYSEQEHVVAGVVTPISAERQADCDAPDGLRLEDVSVVFGGLTAVNQVSAEAKPHMITAIIGANGAGKTTLFNAISGLQEVASGHVWYKGKDLTRLAPADVARLGLARTFQNLRVFSNMSVLDNVMVGRHRHEKSHFLTAGLRLPSQRREECESRKYCLDLLHVLDIADKADEMVGTLPYGQQRLVEIARALATEPTLLLLDEPAAGMNDMERGVLREKIMAIKDLGIQILLVEHDMHLVMGISDYVVVLDHGRLICAGDPEHVQCHPQVVEAYLGASNEQEHAPRASHHERVASLESAPAEGHLLEVRNLSTSYGSIAALRDVSFHVDEGECIAILGANGAGKSTLLRSVCGSTRSRSGEVLFGGRDISRLSTPQIVDLGVCQVLEGRHVFPTLSVYDNLMLGAGRRYRTKAFTDDLKGVFELFPRLEERRQQSAGSLSGGEQQMLAISRALMGRPRVLLLDEPSMGLAPIVVETIFEALRSLNDKGLTLVMVEQNANMALTIADRAVVLVTGKVALAGDAEELRDDPKLNELYLGRAEQ